MKEVAIIGGGITGLTAAYRLVKAGYKVHVLETQPELGGLARSFYYDQVWLERYYHFICMNDRHLLSLLKELGLHDRLRWVHSKMDYYIQGRIYPFSEPGDIFKFSPLGTMDKFRFAFNMLRIKTISNYRKLDHIPAYRWLERLSGKRAYHYIWEPLLTKKFKDFYTEISAAWIYGRTQRRAKSRRWFLGKEQLGYIEGGSKILIDALADRIIDKGGEIRTGCAVTKINSSKGIFEINLDEAGKQRQDLNSYDIVIATAGIPRTLEMAPFLPREYKAMLKKQPYLSVACALLHLDRPLGDKFWVNVYDKMPFLGVIEYTNLNPIRDDIGSIVYLPQYLHQDDERLLMNEEQYLQGLYEPLRAIFPNFNENMVIKSWLFKDDYAQPICTLGHHKRIIPFATPIDDFFLTDASMIYPEDRGVNNSIALADALCHNIIGK